MATAKEQELARLRWVFNKSGPADQALLTNAGVDLDQLQTFGPPVSTTLIHEILLIYYVCSSRARKRYELLADQLDVSAGPGQLQEMSWKALGFSEQALRLAKPSVALAAASMADIHDYVEAYWDDPLCPMDETVMAMLGAVKASLATYPAAKAAAQKSFYKSSKSPEV